MSVRNHESKRRVAGQYAAIIAAVVLVSQLSTHDLSLGKIAISAYHNLANVASLSAAVPSNEVNTLTAQFAQKDRELSLREETLLARERALGEEYEKAIARNNRTTIFVLGAIILLLFLLLLANFYFDIKRENAHEEKEADDHYGEFTTKL